MADTLFKRTDDPYRRTARRFLPTRLRDAAPGQLPPPDGNTPIAGPVMPRQYLPPTTGPVIPRVEAPAYPTQPGSGLPPYEPRFARPLPDFLKGRLSPAPPGPIAGPVPPRVELPSGGIPTTGPVFPGRDEPRIEGPTPQDEGPLAPAARLLAGALRGSYGVNPRMLGALQGGRLPQLNTWGQGWGSRLSPMLMQSLMGLYQSGGYRPEEMAWTLGRMAPTAQRYSPQASF